MIKGIDCLGSALYYKNVIRCVPKHIAVSVLLHSFDRSKKQSGWRAVEMFAKKGFQTIKVVSQWSDDNHQFYDSHLKAAIADAKRLNALGAQYPHIKFLFVPFLEHRKDSGHMARVFDRLRSFLDSSILLVNSPVNGGGENVEILGVINERHHSAIASGKLKTSDGYSFSHDGEDMLNSDLQKTKDQYADAAYYWAWVPQCNLKKTLDQNISRSERNSKTMYLPLLKALVYVLENDKGNTSLPKAFTWKAYAEQKSDAPGRLSRDNKPVLISKQRFNKVRLGKAKLSPSGQLHDGRFVYRMGAWGWKFHKKNGNAELIGNGKVIGVINAAYRENEYK